MAVCLAHGAFLLYVSQWADSRGTYSDPFDYLLTYVPLLTVAFVLGVSLGVLVAFKRARRRQ